MPVPFTQLVPFPGTALGPQGPPGPPGAQILHRYTYPILAGVGTAGTTASFPTVVGEFFYDLSALFPPSEIPPTLQAYFRCSFYTSSNVVSANMDLYDVNGVTTGGTPGPVSGITPLFVASNSGSGASVLSFSTPNATIAGLSGMSPAVVGQQITLSGAAHSGNNGIFTITSYISATEVVISNTAAVAGDTGIVWSINRVDPQYFSANLSSYFVGLVATTPSPLFQARLWMGAVVAGQQAVCDFAKLDLEWT
jgi:hypothetical protein